MKKKATEESLGKLEEREILFTLLADKVGAVDPRDVFYGKRLDAGKSAGKYAAKLGGKKIPPNQLSQLQQEANTLTNMSIWKVLTQTLAHEANLRMFKGMKTLEDAHFGKAILHSIGVIEAIVEAIKEAEHE